MKLINVKSLANTLILSIALSLSACGGSGENNDTGATNNNGSASGNISVSGQFYSSHDTNKYFSTEQMPSYEQYGRNASHCYQQYNDYYYETSNTMVFGNPDLPESDFKQAAQWVENNFSSALNAMGIAQNEYFNLRYKIRLEGLKHIRNNMLYQQYHSVSYPNGYDSWDQDKQNDWATKTTKSLSKQEAVELLINDPYSPFQTENQAVIEDKVYVCLHEKNTTNGWGEGSLMGITIGAPSIAKPLDVEKIIAHELVHTIQHAIAAGFEGLGLPRWLAEGQAVLLSNMDVANKSDHNEYDPTLVVSYFDEYGDPSIAYKHYGLAYQYLVDANSSASIIEMMKDIKQVTYNFSTQLSSSIPEYHGYVQSFDSRMKQKDGSNLTVQQYRNEYHSLMTSY